MSNDPIEKIVSDMTDHVAQLRKLILNQQETLLGVNALLRTHSRTLEMHQKVIEAIASRLGIALDPPPNEDISPLN
jgi:hypothetical protein